MLYQIITPAGRYFGICDLPESKACMIQTPKTDHACGDQQLWSATEMVQELETFLEREFANLRSELMF